MTLVRLLCTFGCLALGLTTRTFLLDGCDIFVGSFVLSDAWHLASLLVLFCECLFVNSLYFLTGVGLLEISVS